MTLDEIIEATSPKTPDEVETNLRRYMDSCDGFKQDFNTAYVACIAYLSGYNPDMKLWEAESLTMKLIQERIL